MKEQIKTILHRQTGKDLFEIIENLQKETFDLEQIQRLRDNSIISIKTRKCILFFLMNNIKPAGFNDSEFQLLKPIVIELVKKEQLDKVVLKQFKDQ